MKISDKYFLNRAFPRYFWSHISHPAYHHASHHLVLLYVKMKLCEFAIHICEIQINQSEFYPHYITDDTTAAKIIPYINIHYPPKSIRSSSFRFSQNWIYKLSFFKKKNQFPWFWRLKWMYFYCVTMHVPDLAIKTNNNASILPTTIFAFFVHYATWLF